MSLRLYSDLHMPDSHSGTGVQVTHRPAQACTPTRIQGYRSHTDLHMHAPTLGYRNTDHTQISLTYKKIDNS